MSGESYRFKAWVEGLIAKNKMTGFEEMSEKLGVTRQTIHNWINRPERIKRVTLEGIRSIMGDTKHSLKELENIFGISK